MNKPLQNMDRNKFGVSATEMEISIKECLCHGIIKKKNCFSRTCVRVCVWGGGLRTARYKLKMARYKLQKKSEIKSYSYVYFLA